MWHRRIPVYYTNSRPENKRKERPCVSLQCFLCSAQDRSGTDRVATVPPSGAEDTVRVLSSTEFQGRNLGDEDYVRALYGACLNRGADETGFAGWLSEMAEGVSRNTIADSLSSSGEFKAIVEDMKN